MNKIFLAAPIFLAVTAAHAATTIPYTFTGTLAAAAGAVGICTFKDDSSRVDLDFTGANGTQNLKQDDADIAVSCTQGADTPSVYVLSIKGDDQSTFTNRARAYMTSFKLGAPSAAPSPSDFDYSEADTAGGSLPGFEGFASIKFVVTSAANADFFNGTNAGSAFKITTSNTADILVNIRIGGKIQSLDSFDTASPSPARYNFNAADSDWRDVAPTYGPYVNQNPLQDNRIYLIAAETTSGTPTPGGCQSPSLDCVIDAIPDQLPF